MLLHAGRPCQRPRPRAGLAPVIAAILLVVAAILIGALAVTSFSSWTAQRTTAADSQSCAADAALALENVRVRSTIQFPLSSEAFGAGTLNQTHVNSSGHLKLNWTDFATNLTVNATGNWSSAALDSDSNLTAWTSASFSGPWKASGQIRNDTFNTTGLVLLMHLNNESSLEYNGSFFLDNSSYGNNGTCTACPAFNASGKIKGAGTLDGTDDQITIVDAPALDANLGNAATFSFWIQPANVAQAAGGIMNKRTNFNNQNSWSIGVNYCGEGGVLSVEAGNGSGNANIIGYSFNTSSLSTTRFTHIAVVYATDAAADAKVTAYFNGVPQPRVASASCDKDNGTSAFYDSTAQVRIGKVNDAGGNFFNGTLDEVAIWNRTLSANEVAQLYAMGAARLGVQVRSCADSACAGAPFVGPDNTSSSYWNESAILLNSTFAPDNRYAQLKLNFSTENTSNTSWVTDASLSAASPMLTGRLRNLGRMTLGNFTLELAFANGSVLSFPAAQPAPTDNLTAGQGAPLLLRLPAGSADVAEVRVRSQTCPRLSVKAAFA